MQSTDYSQSITYTQLIVKLQRTTQTSYKLVLREIVHSTKKIRYGFNYNTVKLTSKLRQNTMKKTR